MPVRRRALILLLPAALVALGLFARAAADRAFAAFAGYRPPFRFAPPPQRPLPALSERVLLVLMDGVGVDASRRMPFLNDLRSRGASLECRTGLPSLSLPARAVLMTGAWQDVHGQATNYDARALTVEHLFQIAQAQGRSTALAAGAKTQAMFAPYVGRAAVHDDEPETAPFSHYEAALERQRQAGARLMEDSRADFTQLELTLADEAGHGWGAASPEYARAAARVDEAVRALAASIDLERETLVVTADHGHVATGGHGGPEPDVIQVPLVMAGRGVRAGAAGTCAQVDVAPTVAVLLGLPLPAASQGAPLVEALDLAPEARRAVLRNAVAQRAAFVDGYARVLAELDGPAAAPAALRRTQDLASDGDGDEKALAARLAALANEEAALKDARREQEAPSRWRRAALLAAAPLVLLALLGWGRAFAARELAWAAVFALAGALLYHALLPALGLGYSLTAVNKDEWLRGFFQTDMALGLACCVAAAAALCVWRRRRGADLLALCRHVWLCATVFCSVFALKVAFVYARQEVVPRWFLPDQYWGMTFYLDALVMMAVGLVAPAFALLAGLARLLPAARGLSAAAA